MSSLFSEKKAAEVAAYFLLRAKSRRANVTLLKLMKLMYLAERLSYERFGFPITGDRLVSMQHGPVLSQTLNLMNAGDPAVNPDWFRLIAEKSDNGRDMSLNSGDALSVDDLRELSESDLEVLDSTWQNFGGMSAIALRNWTHDPKNVPEWQDPDGSSYPIELRTLLTVLGYSDDAVRSIDASTRQQAWINSKLSAQ